MTKKKRIGWVTVADMWSDYRSQQNPLYSFDDYAAVAALEKAGYEVEPVIWNQRDVASLKDVDLLLVRSPQSMDFVKRMPEFLDWLGRAEKAGVAVANPAGVCRWNSDKHYLLDLEKAGAEIVPTHFIAKGAHVDLAVYMKEHGYEEVVVKPAVSIGGLKTYRVRRDEGTKTPLSPQQFDAQFHDDGVLARTPTVSQFQQKFDALCADEEMLVSPYMPEITKGEWSFLFFNGKFSHAIRKEPQEGKYLIHVHHGGSINTEIIPPPALVQQAQAMIDAVPAAYKSGGRVNQELGPLLYARVDGVESNGRLKMLELEMLEPMLYFRDREKPIANFIAAVKEHFTALEQVRDRH